MLNVLVGTRCVHDAALNVATELSRGFHLGAIVGSVGRESQGLLCYGADMATGRSFGAGGPRGKMYSWDHPEVVNKEIEWACHYSLSPSGMLAEAMGEAGGYEGGVWPHAQTITSEAFSVAVSSADFELRIARALQLIEPGTPSIRPGHERTLSYCFSGNALLLAGVSWGAYLSSGIDWALLNGMLTPSSDLTTTIKALVPLVTNGRVTNCVDAKRRLYRQGVHWQNYADATRYSSTNFAARDFKDALSFPMPMFVIRAVMENLGLQLKEPPTKQTYYDPDEDKDSAFVGVVSPVERNWLFAPWVCDTMGYVRRKFSIIMTAPLGKDERTPEVSVWPYAWTDTVVSHSAQFGRIRHAGGIRRSRPPRVLVAFRSSEIQPLWPESNPATFSQQSILVTPSRGVKL
ncbi:hypothetical protein HPB51_024064 [Rhipicephalus microplus]|uniref:Uncharacterized protein n=1 Tax=Rhipicephalus microplus TaxID=6941 RepID=A0A9J6EDH7_RHIMP|nr:hypothetical protein HPB51_024064 [Rhipicephalus microplus]